MHLKQAKYADDSEIDASKFLLYLSDTKNLIPTLVNPMSIFFLSSLDNFLEAWELWLGPSLQYSNHFVSFIIHDIHC
jgi:hypothetical protein